MDDYGCLVISELIALSKAGPDPLFRDVAALIWRNGTQGFAFEGREVWHALERPIGSKQEAWFPTRWSKYRTGENKRGSLNDHLMAWGGTYRLASLQQLDKADRDWLASVSPVETEVTLSNRFGTARVELRGANMRSWRPSGEREVLGRLGVPVYWPWAIREGEPGCDIHGLTPYFDWTVKERTADRVVLAFSDDEVTRRVWPHRFRAEMEYRIGEALALIPELQRKERLAGFEKAQKDLIAFPFRNGIQLLLVYPFQNAFVTFRKLPGKAGGGEKMHIFRFVFI